MCTVTYLPNGSNQYILTSNRDEWPGRPTSTPIKHDGPNGITLLYPTDGMAGGSWIAISNNGATACLLNGAYERHERNPPYRRSRGLVLVDAFAYESFADFVMEYDFSNIEPFTLLFVADKVLHELRWDGVEGHYSLPNPNKPHIWASATLYIPEYIAKRKGWFTNWLQSHSEYKPEDIISFHRNGGEGDKYNDIVMNREGLVQTVSITCVAPTIDGVEMIYEDLLNGDKVRATF